MYGDWTRENLTLEGTFSINTLAKACGISRATLLRMEQEGLLKPAYVNPDNSYRYYDYKSIAEVIRVLNYQQLGFTKKEILDLYNDPSLIKDSLSLLKEHYEFVLRELEELTLKIDNNDDIKIRETEISAGYYYEKTANIIYNPEHVRRMALSGIQEFVSQSLSITGLRPMQLFIDDESDVLGSFDYKEHTCKLILPTESSYGTNIVHYDSYKALSLVCKYNYYKSENLFHMLWEEALRRNLTPVGPIHITGLPEVVFDSIPGGDKNTLRILLRVK